MIIIPEVLDIVATYLRSPPSFPVSGSVVSGTLSLRVTFGTPSATTKFPGAEPYCRHSIVSGQKVTAFETRLHSLNRKYGHFIRKLTLNEGGILKVAWMRGLVSNLASLEVNNGRFDYNRHFRRDRKSTVFVDRQMEVSDDFFAEMDGPGEQAMTTRSTPHPRTENARCRSGN